MRALPLTQDRAVTFTTPAEAVRAMVDRGARFRIVPRTDSLPLSFIFEMITGSTTTDLERCRAILRAVKEKPPQFFAAFRSRVCEIAAAPDAGT